MTLFSANLTPSCLFFSWRQLSHKPSNHDVERCYVVLLMKNVTTHVKARDTVQTSKRGNFKRSVQDGGILAESEGIFYIFNLFVC